MLAQEIKVYGKQAHEFIGLFDTFESVFHIVGDGGVRKVLYTTNAVESVNSSFRKVTKKGAFPNENALLKLRYLRITELYKKWNGRPLNNWALVRNQLDMDEKNPGTYS